MIKNKLEILEVLHPTAWKSAQEVWAEVIGKRGQTVTDANRFRPGWVPMFLRDLCEDGWAVDRERALPPERLVLRGGRPELEYRLTDEGIRRRVEPGKERPDALPVEA